VCGLNVVENLQYLTKQDNGQRKGNSFDWTLENESWRVKPNQQRQASITKKETVVDLSESLKGLDIIRSYSDDSFRPDFTIQHGGKDLVVYVDPLRKDVPRDYFQIRKHWEKEGVGYRIFYLDEYLHKEHLIVSNIKSYFGMSRRVYARKCEIKPVKYRDAAAFFEQNHLMGTVSSSCYGLFYEGEMVACLSTSKRNKVLHIARSCSVAGTNVIGGFSKLEKYVFENMPELDKIESFVDLRYGDGSSYKKTNWRYEGTTQSFKWVDGLETYHRLKCRANMDERGLTQAQQAEELGWWRVYDAGQSRYSKLR